MDTIILFTNCNSNMHVRMYAHTSVLAQVHKYVSDKVNHVGRNVMQSVLTEVHVLPLQQVSTHKHTHTTRGRGWDERTVPLCLVHCPV